MTTATQGAANTATEPSAEEHRAFLQRGETRLSTLHRVAGSFISGAGLLTLLPVLINNVFSGMLASLIFRDTDGIPDPASFQRWLVLIPVLASMGLPLAALYLLIRDLTQFYYTPRPFQNKTVGGVYPRFILSGLRVPNSDHTGHTSDPPLPMQLARQERYITDLIVPSTHELRRRLLREANTVGELNHYNSDDGKALEGGLKTYLFDATGAEYKSLAQESAKMEASIVRHQRKLLTLVLRYAKAFLLTIVTTVVTIIAAGTLSLLSEANNQTAPIRSVSHENVWLVTLTLYACWCVVAVIIVRRPINWVFDEVDNSLAEQTPPSLKSFELATVMISVLAVVAIDASLIMYAFEVSEALRMWPILVAGSSFLAVIFIAAHIVRLEHKEGKKVS